MQELSFEIRDARTPQALAEVRSLRAAAYGHHLPHLAGVLAQPDAGDHLPGTRVLLARDKRSGEAIGTLRLQPHGVPPLALAGCFDLPRDILEEGCLEVTRLAVLKGRESDVRLALFKACWLTALGTRTPWIVLGARSPSLVRLYAALGFTLLSAPGVPVPLPYAGGLPHHVMALDVAMAEALWRTTFHPHHAFMVTHHHPDLHLDDAATGCRIPLPPYAWPQDDRPDDASRRAA